MRGAAGQAVREGRNARGTCPTACPVLSNVEAPAMRAALSERWWLPVALRYRERKHRFEVGAVAPRQRVVDGREMAGRDYGVAGLAAERDPGTAEVDVLVVGVERKLPIGSQIDTFPVVGQHREIP